MKTYVDELREKISEIRKIKKSVSNMEPPITPARIDEVFMKGIEQMERLEYDTEETGANK